MRGLYDATMAEKDDDLVRRLSARVAFQRRLIGTTQILDRNHASNCIFSTRRSDRSLDFPSPERNPSPDYPGFC